MLYQLVSILFLQHYKITHKSFESFVQISMEKNMRSDQVKYCHYCQECLSFQWELKWLMYDLFALKLAQPNSWLENYKFPQIGIQADAHYCRMYNVKVRAPFDLSLISLKSDRC